MKIAFISANREVLPDPVVPIGILSVMANTPDRHESLLWDMCFEDEPLAALASKLRDFEPDVVALGMRNLHNSDYTGTSNNIEYYASLIAVIRAHSSAPLVIGGGGFSVMPEGLMKRLRPDYGIAGEGELAFPELLAALEVGPKHGTAELARGLGELSRIGSLHYFVEGQLVSNRPAPSFLHLDALPPVDRSPVDPRYYEVAGIESLQTKRGCALRCDYCTYPLIEGRSIRLRAPEAVVDEMQLLLERNARLSHFFIVDSVFNIPPKHAKEICQLKIERGLETPWTCYANPLGFDAELSGLMARAHCAGMEIGADSGCDEILEKLRKGFDTDKLLQAHQLCVDAGLKDCHTFLLGTPGESMDHVKRTLDFIIEMNPFAAVLMAYMDEYEVLDRDHAKQRQAFRSEVIELLDSCRPEFPRWIIPALEVNFQTRLFRILRKRGLHGPLWQYLDKIPERPGNKRRARADASLIAS